MEDPEVDEYLQSLGSRIAAQAQDDGQPFQFFAVAEPNINAFALPGGFIGVNQGLVLATANESQLASVLAHEIAHVTQRHIARTVRAQSRQSLASAAAILAAILVGAAAGGGADAMQGAIAIAQGAAAQQQINFTRANEYEADRVGIGFMAAAGFDPLAMPQFFDTMGRRSGLAATRVPEILQTHPVTSNRIAESRNRAAQYPRPKTKDSLSYELIRERMRVLGTPGGSDVRLHYTGLSSDASRLGDRYGRAIAMLAAGQAREAVQILEPLAAEHEGIILLQTALAQAQIASGMDVDGLTTFARAMALFPRNVPLTVRYAEALMSAGQAKEAHRILLDLFNNVAPTPAQIRLTALAASSAGDTGDAYYYMSEYHIASGDLPLAEQQLELALAAPNLTPVQRRRFQARLEEIREVLLSDRSRRRERDAQEESQSRA
jgi:beta-barrel assembly-enhancing protease